MLLLVLAALAQTTPLPSPAEPPPKAQEIDFEGAAITATAEGPSLRYAFEPAHNGFNPLIAIRANFHPEMVQSVDEVK